MMFRLPAFAALLLRYGSLTPRAPDYAQLRLQHLSGLEAYLPDGTNLNRHPGTPSNWRAFAAQLRSALRMQGMYLLHPDEHLYYIRIPKSASTSLARTMLNARFPGLGKLTSTQINFLTDLWGKYSVDKRVLKNAIGFTAVRHPLHRLVSVYRDFFEYPRKSFFIYHGYLFNLIPQHLSFEEFVKRISKIPAPLLDPHLRPQHMFLKPYLKISEVKVFKLEQSMALEEFLHTHHLAFHHENRSAEPYDYRQYYTSALKKIALRVYEDDCRVFGYEH